MMVYQVSNLIIAAVLLHLASIGSSTTWVYTAPRALAGLAGSASAAASAPSLRSSKAEELTKDDESLEDSGFEGDTGNEASPSLLKKKIGKILTKLRLIAQLKNAYHYKPEESDPDDTTVSSSDAQPTDASANISENIQQIPAAAPPKPPVEDTPIRPLLVDLQVNQIDDKLLGLKEETGEKPAEEPRSPLRTLGVFFAELLGSVVGLTYGVVAQISAGGQNPVTISTSEGL